MTVLTDERPITTLTVPCGYFDWGYRNPDEVCDRAREALADVEYDTLVATGISGTALVVMVAWALGKNAVVIRKPTDTQNHSYGSRGVGELGRRWIFFDDFCDSGATQRRVMDAVTEFVNSEMHSEWGRQVYMPEKRQWRPMAPEDFSTTFVGTYEYNYNSFTPAEMQPAVRRGLPR